ncbi:galactokinase [Actinomadura viridis]|uniref:Galactokinase n=1 Tax=Actinomadura viridis TaxID=58110 RepID=A0A931DAG0_9ACTN|nr:galactokinase family protein [Actinomadura viridis]MBG6086575.1 galactokinase [Actinomadura viridis]
MTSAPAAPGDRDRAEPLAAAFTEAYRRPPEGVWHAPGRINVIGEHTDYNDGLVLPFALGRGVSVAAARRDDGVLEVRSLQFAGIRGEARDGGAARAGDSGGSSGPSSRNDGETGLSVPLDGFGPDAVRGWSERERWAAYPVGVAALLRELGIGGASLLFDSDLPWGAGLSSSAALECATALALCDLYGRDDLASDRAGLARLAQRAEHEYVGVPCGLMDQAASLLCTAGHALMLDCRTGLSAQVPLDLPGKGLTLLVVDTGVRHDLAGGDHLPGGGYGRRRAECERAAALLGVPALRDVKDLAAALSRLDDPVLRRRTQHVVTENHRVEATAGLLRAGAETELGAMLTASHLSLRDQYEVSWPEADLTVEAALRAGARGGRMVGGGFGGSVIVLAASGRAEGVRDAITAAYRARGLADPGFLEAVPAPGARRLAPG